MSSKRYRSRSPSYSTNNRENQYDSRDRYSVSSSRRRDISPGNDRYTSKSKYNDYKSSNSTNHKTSECDDKFLNNERDHRDDTRSSHHRSSINRNDTSRLSYTGTPERKKKKKKEKKKSHKSKKRHQDTESEASSIEQALVDQTTGVYSNIDNPFNDMNLAAKFRWAKKEQKEKKSAYSTKDLSRRELERKEEARIELEKLNQRRAEREAEMEFREQEQMRLQREADLAQLGDWEAREDEFHLEQAKRRAEIRIRNRRAKPIDLLAINLKLAYEGDNNDDNEGALPLDFGLDEPYHVFDNLKLPEVDDLKQDIQLYLALERNEANTNFWTDMMVVCEAKLGELRAVAMNLPSRIPDEVLKQLDNMFSSKTSQELDDLQTKIVAKLKSKQPLDTDYWELNLKLITVWKAKSRLRAHHEIVLSKRLEQLKSRQAEEFQQAGNDLALAIQNRQSAKLQDADSGSNSNLLATSDLSLGPTPLLASHLLCDDQDQLIIDPSKHWAKLLRQENQSQALQSDSKTEEKNIEMSAQDFAAKLFRQEREDFLAKASAEDLEIDEEIFDSEVNLTNQPQFNESLYQPRKPMYFNRVHTGYEWNKYNQTHYDVDNPPPKVVQGYKFHIFYPGLLKDPVTGKIPTPSYKLEPDPLSEETQLLRFSAGPPYQDVAFRIVRREWEYSHKKGFKSSFINHTLYLYFHFKRHYYRR